MKRYRSTQASARDLAGSGEAGDPVTALGAVAPVEDPAVACAYCWPRLIQAEHVEEPTGLPCCTECHAKPDKGKPGGPRFLWRKDA